MLQNPTKCLVCLSHSHLVYYGCNVVMQYNCGTQIVRLVGSCNISVKLTDCVVDAMGSIPGKNSCITMRHGVAQSVIVGMCGREARPLFSETV